jgi:hypothetical protein
MTLDRLAIVVGTVIFAVGAINSAYSDSKPPAPAHERAVTVPTPAPIVVRVDCHCSCPQARGVRVVRFGGHRHWHHHRWYHHRRRGR